MSAIASRITRPNLSTSPVVPGHETHHPYTSGFGCSALQRVPLFCKVQIGQVVVHSGVALSFLARNVPRYLTATLGRLHSELPSMSMLKTCQIPCSCLCYRLF